jgi:histidine ammonia-lyase
MIAQYTAASLVSENKVLAHPASVDTIPTSGNQEDHVSMGWTSVRKLREIVANVRSVLAVEVLVASQALDFRVDVASPGAASGAVHRLVREHVPTMDTDRNVSDQIVAVDGLLREIVDAVEATIGELA